METEDERMKGFRFEVGLCCGAGQCRRTLAA